jgi:hypothetical protein
VQTAKVATCVDVIERWPELFPATPPLPAQRWMTSWLGNCWKLCRQQGRRQRGAGASAAGAELGLSWGCAPGIMDRAVERGQLERNLDEVTHVGLDEKSFRRGQAYISVMTDIDASRVLEVSEGRDEAAADVL